ncbi:putative Protein Fatty acyl-CoA reductase [Daphnia magna]|uniref:Fatty acyl-CoA reductase C-terminal domain-containing protein n=1 Tax=Daphnia magna TaxID=35525 RepID=A0A162R1D8_9CRUS|nr:putative Protein Fatty acyl-CoA reductase [Daphnia magna]
MARLYVKANDAFSTFEFFTTHQWRFISNNWIRLMNEMSAEDRDIFYFDVGNINWRNYFESYILGVRLYGFREDISSLPLARRNLNRLYWIRLVVLLLVLVGFILLLSAILF